MFKPIRHGTKLMTVFFFTFVPFSDIASDISIFLVKVYRCLLGRSDKKHSELLCHSPISTIWGLKIKLKQSINFIQIVGLLLDFSLNSKRNIGGVKKPLFRYSVDSRSTIIIWRRNMCFLSVPKLVYTISGYQRKKSSSSHPINCWISPFSKKI